MKPPVIKFTLASPSEVMLALKPTTNELRRVNRLVVNKSIGRIHKITGGAIPRATGSSIGGFRRHRAFKKPAKAKHKQIVGSVWLGGNKIFARYAGRRRNVSGGAMAGNHFFAGAFVAKMNSGYTSIFKRGNSKTRSGKIRLIEQSVEVKDLVPIAGKTLMNVTATSRKLLETELNKLLTAKARRMK